MSVFSVYVLGCGCSVGTPMLGCKCQVCINPIPYNIRTRSSILVSFPGHTLLVDAGPDIKYQLLKAGSPQIDSLIITHKHYDHLAGLNELRPYYMNDKNLKPLNIYTTEDTAKYLQNAYPYLFQNNYSQIPLKLNVVDYYTKLTLNAEQADKKNFSSTPIQLFRQYHAPDTDNLGIRVGNFVYANDVVALPSASEQYLHSLDILILDCKNYTTSKIHLGLDGVMDWYGKYSPKQIYLTNMSHKLSYPDLVSKLPQYIKPCYDGLLLSNLYCG